MSYVEKIKRKMIQTGGIITSKELQDDNIPTIYLTRMTENGKLIRANRGIYIVHNDYDRRRHHAHFRGTGLQRDRKSVV